MKYVGLVVIIFLTSSKVFAQGVALKVIPSLSKIEFEVSHLEVMTVMGHFSSFEVEVEMDTLSNSVLNASAAIHVVSLSTGIDSRDETLLSEAHLDADNYPEILFKTIDQVSDSRTLGQLTIKNITQAVSLKLITNQQNGMYFIEASSLINRSDFGLDFGFMNDLVGEQVKISILIVSKVP